ncbi:MAG: hypothetical protein FWE53_01840 [Firmicutes bacterium]|nr:hypothetical protein [Bacillota bacterium]
MELGDFGSVLLGILAIIGLIALTAFIIIVLIDLILFMFDGGRNGIIFRRRRCESGTKTTTTTVTEERKIVRSGSKDRPLVLEDNTLDGDYKPHFEEFEKGVGYDEELALREQQAIMSSKSGNTVILSDEAERKEFAKEREKIVEERRREFEELDSLFSEDEDEDDSVSEEEAKKQDAYIEEINKKSVDEYKAGIAKPESVATAEEVQEAVVVAEKEVEAIQTEIKQTEKEVTEATTVVETTSVEETEELESAKTSLQVERLKLEELRTQLIEERRILEEERIRLVKLSQIETDEDGGMRFSGSMTLAEINNNLDKLRMRLKDNERELKANKKEFIPLSRVKRTLENDKKKLRRREAIVAKQKVVLYGVNNYIDIDEEKAKKLAEELDLLDGLRLSVQHCEDVMTTNRDRYPILENTNRILTEQNKQLKSDIAELEVKLALLMANQ